MRTILLFIVFAISCFFSIAQKNKISESKINSFGIGSGIARGGNIAFGADYIYSSQNFALSTGAMAFETNDKINEHTLSHEIDFKIGLLSKLSKRSYFTFLVGVSRTSFFYMENNNKIRNYYGYKVLDKRKRRRIEVNTIGFPIQSDIIIGINNFLGVGIKPFINLNGRATYYGCMGSIRFTAFSSKD